jgi:hypothetical protein
VKPNGAVFGLLVCLAASLAFAWRMWNSVLNFDPGFVFKHDPIATGAPLSSSVTVLLVDGLRLDASRAMPALNRLRARGADVEGLVGTPSFSRPGRATVAVGAPPAIHGVTSNRQKRALPLDNLIRRVGALGGTCRIAGSKIWSGLFAADIARCGEYLMVESKEGPGAFERQVPSVRQSQEAGLRFVFEKRATLRLADVVSTDFAAHEYGGTSPQYLAEVARIDGIVAEIASRLDLAKETFVVTTDHGHRDLGGHGGDEPIVLAIPTVMVGAGVRPGSRASGFQADIGPTIAALLGAALPSGSSGSPLESILEMDAVKRATLQAASAAQRKAFVAAVRDRLAASEGEDAWEQVIGTHRAGVFAARTWIAVVVIAACLLAMGLAMRTPGVAAMETLLGAFVALAFGAATVRFRLPPMSFSAINYDDMLLPFLADIMLAAAGVVLVAAVAAFVYRWGMRRRGVEPGRRTTATVGLIISLGLLIAMVLWWWRFGLLLETSISGPGQMVEAYALTLSLASVSLMTLLVVGIEAMVDRARRLGSLVAQSPSS